MCCEQAAAAAPAPPLPLPRPPVNPCELPACLPCRTKAMLVFRLRLKLRLKQRSWGRRAKWELVAVRLQKLSCVTDQFT